MMKTYVLVIIGLFLIVASFFTGYAFKKDSGSSQEDAIIKITELESMVSQLKKQNVIESNNISNCTESLRNKYKSQVVSKNGFIVGFKSDIDESAVASFAEEYGLIVGTDYTFIPFAALEISDGSDVFDKICTLRNDERVDSVNPSVASGLAGF